MMYDKLKLSRIGHYLSEISMNSNALEHIIGMIKHSRILIMLDNCSDMVLGEEAREFVDALNLLAG